MKKLWFLMMSLLVVLGLVSCGERPAPEPPKTNEVSGVGGTNVPADAAGSGGAAASVPDAPRIFLVKGVVKEVLMDRGRVRIAHEKIPDFMEAMTMLFKVKDSKGLGDVAAGDTVRFRMTVTKDDGWIDNLVKIESGSGVADPSPSTFRRVLDVEPVSVGEMMPEYHFTNEQGQAVSLSDFRGKSVAMTFIFTRCAFPTFCPRMAGNFAAAQEKLKALKGDEDDWRLLTVTFDPEFDTPEVLSAYAEGFGYDANRWSFLTGALIDITALAEQFGLMFWRSDPTKPAGIDHNLRTIVIDANGRVQKVLAENEWTVDELVAEILKGTKPAVAGAPKAE